MIIEVKAKANSKKEEIEKISDNLYKVSLKQKAENNKANLELERLMGKYFKKDVKIVRGLRSKNKLLKIG